MIDERLSSSSEKRFLSPRRESNPNLLMTDETLQPLSYQDSDGDLRCKFDIRAT